MSTLDTETVVIDKTFLEVLNGRVSSYKMFSRLFLKPLTSDDIEEMAAMDLVARAIELEGTGLLAEGFNDMGRGLRKRHTGTRQMLATDFTMCFDGVQTVGDEVAVPYASVFLGEKALFNQEPRNEVYKLFCAEGIGLKHNIDLPEDHLSFELEFLAIESERAAAALARGDVADAVCRLKISCDFIDGHILTWIDLLSERANKIFTTRFYRGVMKAIRGYLELDLQTIGDILEDLSLASLADLEVISGDDENNLAGSVSAKLDDKLDDKFEDNLDDKFAESGVSDKSSGLDAVRAATEVAGDAGNE